MNSNFDGGKNYIPVIGDLTYKVILQAANQYEEVRRSPAVPSKGITYLYGVARGEVAGAQAEIIEVWFDRSKWTSSSVRRWMEQHGGALPRPGIQRAVPAGRPALDGGS